MPDPDPEIKEGGGGGGLQKTFLGSKNKGGKGFRTPPLQSATGLAQTPEKTRFLLLKETSSGRKIK